MTKFDAMEYLAAAGVDEQTASDWIELRKVKKAPATATAINMIVKQAAKAGMTVNQALELCCMNGWRGFSADWVAEKTKTVSYTEQKQINDSATLRALGLSRLSVATSFDFIEGEKA